MPVRWWTPLVLLFVCPFMGMAIGVATNLINVQVSAKYYATILDWDLSETPSLVVGQGMREGGALGTVVGLFLAISAIASTRCRCPLGLALSQAFRATAIALVCWITGGLGGLSMAAIADASILRDSIPFAANFSGWELVRFMWVGGSIVGAYYGSGLGLLYSAIALHLVWKKQNPPVCLGFTVAPIRLKPGVLPVIAVEAIVTSS